MMRPEAFGASAPTFQVSGDVELPLPDEGAGVALTKTAVDGSVTLTTTEVAPAVPTSYWTKNGYVSPGLTQP
jgi:hypothetical protein